MQVHDLMDQNLRIWFGIFPNSDTEIESYIWYIISILRIRGQTLPAIRPALRHSRSSTIYHALDIDKLTTEDIHFSSKQNWRLDHITWIWEEPAAYRLERICHISAPCTFPYLSCVSSRVWHCARLDRGWQIYGINPVKRIKLQNKFVTNKILPY